MKPGNFEMEGDSFQEFSSPAIHFPDVGLETARGRCQPEHFAAVEECTTVVEGPKTDVNSLDYARCKTETLLEIATHLGDSISSDNLALIQKLASERLLASNDEHANRLLALVSELMRRRSCV